MLEFLDVNMPGGPTLRLIASATGIRAIEFHPARTTSARLNPHNSLMQEAARQLQTYFSGDRREFQLPLDPEGTDFQKRVWRELQAIPYGETRTYAQVARAIGAPRSVRAVGAANGANPIPIVVPCHRVIGAGGNLVGYGGGLPLKKRLLALEGCNMDLFRR